MMNTSSKVILTDVDGVLLDWEAGFDGWMRKQGFTSTANMLAREHYDLHIHYNIEKAEKQRLVKLFNESAHIGWLPPLRDSIKYVRKLHEEHGYVFHVITSLSLDPYAQALRVQNLERWYGQVFTRYTFLDTGADKYDALEEYRDSGLLWVEDKLENAVDGLAVGLDSVLIRHRHNENDGTCPVLANWKEVYDYAT